MTDLSFHVRTFIPDAAGEELAHRETLLKARDQAAALRGRTQCLRAFNLAVEAHEVAGEFVFAEGETVQRLEFAAKLARYLMAAAIFAEYLDPEGNAHG